MSISRLRRRGGRVRCFRHQRCGNCRAWLGGRPSAAVPHSFPSHILLLLSCSPHFLVLSCSANLTTSFCCIVCSAHGVSCSIHSVGGGGERGVFASVSSPTSQGLSFRADSSRFRFFPVGD